MKLCVNGLSKQKNGFSNIADDVKWNVVYAELHTQAPKMN